jgi:hypothetical protein
MEAPRFIPAPDQGGSQIVVMAAELHEKALVIVLATTIFEELAAADFFTPKDGVLSVEDDVGTEYRRAFQVGFSSEWSSSHGVHRWNIEFEPPVPLATSYLRVRLGPWGNVILMV